MVANLTTRLGQLTSSPAGGPYTGANKIINGDMAIDQRNAGVSVTIPNANTYVVDRFAGRCAGSNAAMVQDTTTPPAGFAYSLKWTVGVGAAPGSSDINNILQFIEGLNCLDLGFGSASAKTVTLSFWVRSSLTGQYSGTLQNSAADRSYPFTYTVNIAATWELKTVSIPGDTTGTWLVSNGIGMRVRWDTGTGATFLSTAATWQGGNYFGVTGSVSLIATSSATIAITGVKLEVGSIATPFMPDDYEVSLGKCLRYFYRWNGTASNECVAIATNVYNAGTGDNRFAFPFPVPMRAIPTLATTGTFQLLYNGYSSLSATIAGTDNSTVTTLSGTASGLVGGNVPSSVRSASTSSLQLSAEL
jgi:hypothetical protein